MADSIKYVSLQAPGAAIDPIGVALQQQQIARNQQIAQQLRQMSLQDTQVAPGSRVSWTQGLARMVDAVASSRSNRQSMAQAYALGLQQTNADRALSNLQPLPDTANPYSTDETGRSGLQRVGDFFRGGPPVDPQALGEALNARVAGINGQPQQSAPSSTANSPGPAGMLPTDGSGIPGNGTIGSGSPKPTDQVSNVPPSPDNSDPSAAPLPGSDPARMANLDGLVQALQSQQAPSTPAPTPQVLGAALAGQNNPQPVQDQPAPPQQPGGAPATMPQMSGQPQPNSPPQTSPSVTSGPQSPPQQGPMDPNIPGMTAQDGYRLRVTQPDVYKATVQSYLQPTDLQRNLLAEGMRPGTPEWNAAIAAQVRHDGTLQMRPGGTDRYGDQFTFNPVLPQGVTPQRDATGAVTGVTAIPGVTDAITSQSAAGAEGPAKYDLTQTYNPQTHQNEFRSRYAVATSPTPLPATPPLGTAAGSDASSKLGAQGFANDAEAGRQSGTRTQILTQLGNLFKVTPTGEGTPGMADFKGRINTYLTSIGAKPWFDGNGIANVQEIQKDASALAQQQASALGGTTGATDAKLSAAFASLPDASKTTQAAQDIINTLQDRESAARARTAASAQYHNQNGDSPTSYSSFNATWTKNYDPRIFQWMREGTVGQHMQALKRAAPAEYDSLKNKSQALADMGAFGQ